MRMAIIIFWYYYVCESLFTCINQYEHAHDTHMLLKRLFSDLINVTRHKFRKEEVVKNAAMHVLFR